MVEKWAEVTHGNLYGWHKILSDEKRHDILVKIVKKDSYATTVRRLNQLRNLTTDKDTKIACKNDMKWLHKKFRSES